MPFRVDIGSELRPAKYLADGGARVDATLTRTGVFVYAGSDGKPFREYRPDSEVFAPESLASFEALPVTDDHPPEMVTADNRDTYKKGRASDSIRRDGTHMVGSLIIDSPDLVAKMKAGKRQVSNGYSCDLEMTAGVSPDGEVYDAIQRNIRGNHIAIVDAGRAGTAMVRMDGVAYQVTDGNSAVVEIKHDAATAAKEFVMDELKLQLAAALAEIAKEKARADKAESDRDAATARADRAEGERDSEKSRADAADKARTDATAAMPVAVKARVALVTKASTVLGAEFKIDNVALIDADDGAIKRAVIKHVDGVDVAADATAGYVDGRFDGCCQRADKSIAAVAAARTVVVNNTQNTDEDREVTSRRKMLEDSRNAYKTASKEGE